MQLRSCRRLMTTQKIDPCHFFFAGGLKTLDPNETIGGRYLKLVSQDNLP
jgi:hypothetical protein